MRFCLIDSKNRKYFDDFIPGRYERELGDKSYLTLGMFDERGPLGAVIMRKNHTVMEIISLNYVEGLEDGECEAAFVEFVKDDGFRNIYDYINIVNNNPELYGRKGMKELQLTVWDTYGHSMTFEEVKEIMEKKRPKKK